MTKKVFEGPNLNKLVGKFCNLSLENIRGQNTAAFNPHNKATK